MNETFLSVLVSPCSLVRWSLDQNHLNTWSWEKVTKPLNQCGISQISYCRISYTHKISYEKRLSVIFLLFLRVPALRSCKGWWCTCANKLYMQRRSALVTVEAHLSTVSHEHRQLFSLHVSVWSCGGVQSWLCYGPQNPSGSPMQPFSCWGYFAHLEPWGCFSRLLRDNDIHAQ